MMLYLYKIGTETPILTIEDVISYTADQVVARDAEHGGAEIIYGPLSEKCELSATPDCTGTLRADWRAAQKLQDIPLPLRPGIVPADGASNSYRRGTGGLVVVSVAVALNAAESPVCVADLPEGYRPPTVIRSDGITIRPDGTVWTDGSASETVCYYT